MDSLTQALLGASVQGALLGRWQGRKALLYGAALGTLPDLDVLIDYGDPVAEMTYHRGFSHSLLVLGALQPGADLADPPLAPAPRLLGGPPARRPSPWCSAPTCCWTPSPATAPSCSGR